MKTHTNTRSCPLAVLLIALAVLPMGAMTEQRGNCGTWMYSSFWEEATVAHVVACLDADMDVNDRDRFRMTPLHRAAEYNEDPAVIEALLKVGADVTARDKFGSTSLHRAAAYNANPAVIETLLKAGAEVNTQKEGGVTPLYWAARFNENPEVIKVLLEAGADVNSRNRDGETPLDVATQSNGNPAVIEALRKGEAGGAGAVSGSESAGPCLIPNFPNHDPKSVTDIEIPWCPSGGPQVESFAGMAVVYQCSLSMLEDPEKIREFRRRISEYCKRLDAMKQLGGDWQCQCPPGFGQLSGSPPTLQINSHFVNFSPKDKSRLFSDLMKRIAGIVSLKPEVADFALPSRHGAYLAFGTHWLKESSASPVFAGSPLGVLEP